MRRGADEPRSVALGPTGRPLHPVGALFEAAFRRFGQRMVAYVLYTSACALPLAVVAWAISAGDIGGWPAFFVVSLAWALGHLALVGILTGLVTGRLRERAGSIAIAVVVGAIVIAIPAALLPPFGLASYPFVVFGPIAAAAGDREGLGAVAYGARLAGRYIGRAALVVFGLVIVSLFLWFGFVVALSPVEATVRQVGAFAAVTLIVWPVAALVARNLYGDLTGRLVIREADGEADRQADLERRGRRRD
jgi:hypothetical protein